MRILVIVASVAVVVCCSALLQGALSGQLYDVTTRIGNRCFTVALTRSVIDEQNVKDSGSLTALGFSEASGIAKSAANASRYKPWIIRLHSVEFDRWPLLRTPICIVRFSAQIDGSEGLLAFIVLPNGRVLLPEPCSS
jgi:hypothetical protein